MSANNVKNRKKTSRKKCCVMECQSSEGKNPELSFHNFPKKGSSFVERLNYFGNTEKIDRRDVWMKNLKINLDSDVNRLIVCSKHFKKDNYLLPEYSSFIRQTLKKNAVPTQNIPTLVLKTNKERSKRLVSVRSEGNEQAGTNILHVEKKESTENDILSAKTTHTTNDVTDRRIDGKCELASNDLEDNVEVGECLEHLINFPMTECQHEFQELSFDEHVSNVEEAVIELNKKIVSSHEIGIQVNVEDPPSRFCSIIKTDDNLITLCGIRNFNILDKICKLVDEYFPRKKSRRLSTKEQIILVMIKLKLDLSFKVLCILFNTVSLSTCRDIFYDMLEKLSCIMEGIFQFVPPEEISRNIPLCFKGFEDTVMVLDCTEVPAQRPKCVQCRIKMYSQYKSDFTFKFMTGVTPAGLLTFVSKAYGGGASDKTIFEQSNIIGKLRRDKDAIMVDKGFLIDDVCAAHGIKLIRPPILRSKKQFTEEEAHLNRRIAAARVHVEVMNQRIRSFNILNNSLAWNLWDKIDQIFLVCCGFTNLGSPIMSDNKFMM